MPLIQVGPGKQLPESFNVIIEIPSHSDPIKYEVDKDYRDFVDREHDGDENYRRALKKLEIYNNDRFTVGDRRNDPEYNLELTNLNIDRDDDLYISVDNIRRYLQTINGLPKSHIREAARWWLDNPSFNNSNVNFYRGF